MSQKSLPEIFAELPCDYQKTALLETLERMFAAGEWGRIDDDHTPIKCTIEKFRFLA